MSKAAIKLHFIVGSPRLQIATFACGVYHTAFSGLLTEHLNPEGPFYELECSMNAERRRWCRFPLQISFVRCVAS